MSTAINNSLQLRTQLYSRRRCVYTPLSYAVLSEGTRPNVLILIREKKEPGTSCPAVSAQNPEIKDPEKMAVPMMMSMAAATATPPSGFSCCNDGIADRGPDTTAKDRWDGLVRRANASALLPPLAHLACPLLPRSRDIVGAALCHRSALWVRAWGEVQGKSPGGPSSPVFCCLRWLARIWASFFSSKSCRRLRLWCRCVCSRAPCSSRLALRAWTMEMREMYACHPSPSIFSASPPQSK